MNGSISEIEFSLSLNEIEFTFSVIKLDKEDSSFLFGSKKLLIELSSFSSNLESLNCQKLYSLSLGNINK